MKDVYYNETETVVVGTLTANGKAAGSATQQDAEQGLLIPVMSAPDIAHPLLAKHNASHRGDSDTYIAQTITGGARPSGGYSHDDLPLVAHALRADGFDASEDGTGRGTPLVPVAYSIMPQNSGKDYKARPVDVAQPLMASGPVGGDQSGDYIVQPIAFNARQDPIHGPITGPLDTDGGAQAIAFSCKDHGADAGDIAPTLRSMGHASSHPNGGGQVAVAIPINPNALRGEGEARTPSADAAGNVRLRDPGMGIGSDGDPADTLTAAGPGAVAFSLRTNQTGANGANISEDLGYSIQANEAPQAVAFSLRGREGGAMPEVEAGNVSPGLRAADGGSTRPFVAFTQNSRSEVREIGGDGQIVGALAADAGAQQQNYIAAGEAMAVRRITVVEACRLQGFDDLIIGGVECSECQPLTAPVRTAELGYGLLASVAERAPIAGGEIASPLSASDAEQLLKRKLRLADGSAPSAVSAPLFLRKGTWRSTDTLGLVLFSSASGAGHPSAFRLPAHIVGTALADALTTPGQGPEATSGAAGSATNATSSTRTQGGARRSGPFGKGTTQLAGAAMSAPGSMTDVITSITSPPPPPTRRASSMPAIWCCFVSPATAGFIPAPTPMGFSCACPTCGRSDGAWHDGLIHTLIEWPTANRKGEELAEQIDYLVSHGFDPERAAVLAQTPDGPQYRGIGNSKAVPLVRKIGERYGSALRRFLEAGKP